jgi:RNA polymerase sigma factor (sigma-70 family)
MTFPASGRAAFPTTHGSVIAAVRDGDPARRRAARETLVTVYWRPVYTRLRLKWRAEPADAEDLTQEFFARAVEREFFRDYAPERARFRTYLRLCLDRFASNARRADRRLKRGGGAVVVPLGTASAERELAADPPDAEDADRWFDRQWVRGLFEASIEALRRETEGTPREIRYRVLLRHDIEPARDEERPSYREVADELGIPVTQVTNHLAWARRELRRLVLERLAVLTGSDAEVREEAAMLIGGVG